MSFKAAAAGLVVFLLSVSVIQGQDGWRVTYTSTEICAVKGSTVEIHCSYRYPSKLKVHDATVKEKLWFTRMNGNEPLDLKTDSEYAGRVQEHCVKTDCTLRITDLRESDSAEYKFMLITDQTDRRFAALPGVTLSVTALQVQVTRITVWQSVTEAELKCHSSCSPAGRLYYVWFKNKVKITGAETSSYKDSFHLGDIISCALQGYEQLPSPSVYAPKLPSVSVSPSAEIVEGSSVTLTCSSDANPAAKYTWYKENVNLKPPSEEPQLVFSSIQSSDSGWYYCTAENELGRRTSNDIIINVKSDTPKLPSVSVSPSAEIVEGSSVTLTCSSDANPAANYTWHKEDQTLLHGSAGVYHFATISSEDSGIYYCKSDDQYSVSVFIDVQYAPKLPSVSVSPSAEIVEGRSVTLTCSSDANPAANYNWYKENQTLLQGSVGIYHFTSISSEDRGSYHCMCQNQHGQINSSSLFVNVQYAPKLPSVSVSPSAEIVEGSSVNLTCSSDANPAANYTWYKENEDSPKASGQIFTISNITAEHSGNYYCESQNTRGRHNSTLHLTVVADKSTNTKTIITVTPVYVMLILLPLALLSFVRFMKKKLSSTTELNEPSETLEQSEFDPCTINSSALSTITAAQIEDAKEQKNLV